MDENSKVNKEDVVNALIELVALEMEGKEIPERERTLQSLDALVTFLISEGKLSPDDFPKDVRYPLGLYLSGFWRENLTGPTLLGGLLLGDSLNRLQDLSELTLALYSLSNVWLGVGSVLNSEEYLALSNQYAIDALLTLGTLLKEDLDVPEYINEKGIVVRGLLALSVQSPEELLKDPQWTETSKLIDVALSRVSSDDFAELSDELRFGIGVYLLSVGDYLGLINHLKLAAELFDTIPEESEGYGGALINKATALSDLAELGVNSIENLQLAVETYDKALKTLHPESPIYGVALMNKAVALGILAELGVNPVENLRLAVETFDKALETFNQEVKIMVKH